MLRATAIVSKTTNRQSLVQGNDYEIIGIDDSCLRVIDESGEPGLFPKSYFLEGHFCPPPNWVLRKFDEDEYSYDPPELSEPGFYEDYADGHEAALATFRQYRIKSTGF